MDMDDTSLDEAFAFGLVTFVIGSSLMLIPIKGIWWAYAGTFLVGFIGYYVLKEGFHEDFKRTGTPQFVDYF